MWHKGEGLFANEYVFTRNRNNRPKNGRSSINSMCGYNYLGNIISCYQTAYFFWSQLLTL